MAKIFGQVVRKELSIFKNPFLAVNFCPPTFCDNDVAARDQLFGAGVLPEPFILNDVWRQHGVTQFCFVECHNGSGIKDFVSRKLAGNFFYQRQGLWPRMNAGANEHAVRTFRQLHQGREVAW